MSAVRLLHLPWLLLALVALPPAARAEDEEPQVSSSQRMDEYVEGASRLEGRIMAPCCWMQTIDIHGSPVAEELRGEIRRRLKAGESPDAIEQSFVQRYGPKILAVPDSSPVGGLALLLAAGFGSAGVGAYFMLKRWTRAGKAHEKPPSRDPAKPAGAARDALDERLDRELSEIGDQA